MNIYNKDIDVVNLRKKIGMIFQESNPFAKSVYDNAAFGPQINGISQRNRGDENVEYSLQQVARTSDYTAFFYLGELIEFNKNEVMFSNPAKRQTEDYISGRFG